MCTESAATGVTSLLYPELPTNVEFRRNYTEGNNNNDVITLHDRSYRLLEISQLKKLLEDEKDKRAALYKKYHRGANILDSIDTALLTAGM